MERMARMAMEYLQPWRETRRSQGAQACIEAAEDEGNARSSAEGGRRGGSDEWENAKNPSGRAPLSYYSQCGGVTGS